MTIGLHQIGTLFAFAFNLGVVWVITTLVPWSDTVNATGAVLLEDAKDLGVWAALLALGFFVLKGALSFPFSRVDVKSSSTTHGAFRNGGHDPWP